MNAPSLNTGWVNRFVVTIGTVSPVSASASLNRAISFARSASDDAERDQVVVVEGHPGGAELGQPVHGLHRVERRPGRVAERVAAEPADRPQPEGEPVFLGRNRGESRHGSSTSVQQPRSAAERCTASRTSCTCSPSSKDGSGSVPAPIARDEVGDLVHERVAPAQGVPGRLPAGQVRVTGLGHHDPAEALQLGILGAVEELQLVQPLQVERQAAGRTVDLDPDRVLPAGREPGGLVRRDRAAVEPAEEQRCVVDGDLAELAAGRGRGQPGGGSRAAAAGARTSPAAR